MDLLDISKIQSGSIQLNMKTFDMNDLLAESIAELQTVHASHQINFTRIAPVIVCADYFRVEQVIINFVNNAVKYSPDADTVDVAVRLKNGLVTVEVKDYGIGIDEQHVGKIFERYYRVGEVSHHFQGLGLGLYISAEVISKHAGKFGIESKPEHGSTFWFSLPEAAS
jgi:signal transduction histidine kinase